MAESWPARERIPIAPEMQPPARTKRPDSRKYRLSFLNDRRTLSEPTAKTKGPGPLTRLFCRTIGASAMPLLTLTGGQALARGALVAGPAKGRSHPEAPSPHAPKEAIALAAAEA